MRAHKDRFSIFFALVAFCPLIFASCGAVVSSGKAEYDVDDGEDLADSQYYRNLGDSTSIMLEGVYGKRLFYVNYNNAKPLSSGTGGSTIPAQSTRYITAASGIEVDGSVAQGRAAFPQAVAAKDAAEELSLEKRVRQFEEPEELKKAVLKGVKGAARRGARSAAYSHDANSFYNNDEVVEYYLQNPSRKIFVDDSLDTKHYAEKDATLCAVGRYNEKPVVLVWVVDENLDEKSGKNCGGKIVSKAVAQDVADRFAAYYYHERAVFGEEYDFLIDKNYLTAEREEYKIGDTGSLVNIVIYDIANDFGLENDTGIVGYFFGSKDYFKKGCGFKDARAYTNAGKYFYLDAPFCNGSSSSSASSIALSTLFHEFQHMIHFGQKTLWGTETSVWYNEMLSMLCEDMLSNSLNTGSSAPQCHRINDFKSEYFYSGIDEFREDDYTISSYATSYTFGAWLSREFGGPEFVRSMSQDHLRSDMESVVYSVYARKGKSYSPRQLYKLFIQACVFHPDFAQKHNLPSLKKDAGGGIEAYGIKSSMSAIDLFSSWPVGVRLFENGTSPECIRPHGFVVHPIGKAAASTVVLHFSPRVSANEDVMIYIQDDF